MKKFISFTLIGRNKPGFVTQVFKNIFDNNINIHQSKMFKLSNNFVIAANAEIYPNSNIEQIINKYSNFKDLNIDKIDNFELIKKAEIKIKNSDEPGIIHNTSEIISNLDLNIITMESYISIAPICGQNIFNLKTKVDITDIDFDKFNNQISDNLENLGYDFEISKIN